MDWRGERGGGRNIARGVWREWGMFDLMREWSRECVCACVLRLGVRGDMEV